MVASTATFGSGKYRDTATAATLRACAILGRRLALCGAVQMLNIHETQKMAPPLNIHGDNATLSVVAMG